MSFDEPKSMWVKDWYTPGSSELSGDMGYALKIKLNGWHRCHKMDRQPSVTTHEVLDLNQWRYNDKVPIRRASQDETVALDTDELNNFK